MMDRKSLVRAGLDLRPTVQVGKNGLTDALADEVDAQLNSRDLIKIRFLRSAGPSTNWRERLEEVAGRLKASIIDIRGGTALLYRRGKGRSR